MATKATASSTETSPTPRTLKLPVNDDVLKRVYTMMLKCRLNERQKKDSGQSFAALAGAVVELATGDAILAPVARDLVSILDGPSVIPTKIAGSSQLAFAAGVALANKLHKSDGVVVAFIDAAMLAYGASHEALSFAAAHKLPLITMVCAAESESSNSDTDTTLWKAEAYGIPGIVVDINDAVAIYRVAKEAIHHARAGRGPSLIQCCQSDVDAIGHMEHYLRKQGSWSEEWKRELAR